MAADPIVMNSGATLTAAAIGGAGYYTAAANTTVVIKTLSVVNPTGAVIVISVYIVPSGGAAGAANAFVWSRSLAPGETYTCPELVGWSMAAGSFLDASGLNATIKASGVRII